MFHVIKLCGVWNIRLISCHSLAYVRSVGSFIGFRGMFKCGMKKEIGLKKYSKSFHMELSRFLLVYKICKKNNKVKHK